MGQKVLVMMEMCDRRSSKNALRVMDLYLLNTAVTTVVVVMRKVLVAIIKKDDSILSF